MLKLGLSIATVLGGALGVWTAATAGEPAVEFAAETVHSGPQGTSKGRMFVGKNRVRMETSQGGQEIVQILDNERQVQWILYPAQRSYMEQSAPGGGSSAAPPAGDSTSPCAGIPGATCEKVGSEAVNGRAAEKWTMRLSFQGQTLEGTHWVDAARGFSLRTEMSDGRKTELRILGEESLNGRHVEKWQMVSSAPGQPEQKAYQWYDPKLQMAIRQEFPNGYVQELVSIQEGEQPHHLFSIPAGYNRIPAPTPQQGPR